MFAKVIEEIREALARQSTFLNKLGDRRAQSNVEHRRILTAIAAGSEAAAVAAMTTHLRHVENALTNIGTGLFLGAGGRLAQAGPSLAIVYAVCGLVAFFMVRSLGELIQHRPSSGAFVSYEFIGEKGAYVAGWMHFLNWSTNRHRRHHRDRGVRPQVPGSSDLGAPAVPHTAMPTTWPIK